MSQLIDLKFTFFPWMRPFFGKVTNEVGVKVKRQAGRQARGGRRNTKMQVVKGECGQLGGNDGAVAPRKDLLCYQRKEMRLSR